MQFFLSICVNCLSQVHEKCVINKKIVQFKCRKCRKDLRNMENTFVPNVTNGVKAENTAALEVANGPEYKDNTVPEVAMVQKLKILL